MKKCLIITLLICLSVAYSCNEPVEILTIPEEPKVTLAEIDPIKDIDLMRLLPSVIKSGRSLETEHGEIDLSKAIKVVNPFDTITRYTLRFIDENSLAFENLIIKETNQGVTSYILKYEPDVNWMISRGGIFENKTFTGKIKVIYLDGTAKAEAFFQNGVGVDYSYFQNPNGKTNCDGSGSGGGSGGGGSGGGGSGGGGGGGGEPCDWWISETTGGLVIDCPGLPLQFFLRTSCDPTLPDYKICPGDDALVPVSTLCPEDPIGILPPGNATIVQLLKAQLEEEPFLIIDNIPCSEVQKWTRLAGQKPPQAVIDKIKNLDENYTSIVSGDWDIQYIENASGPVVNMDYFPVTISTLPNDPTTGQRYTAQNFYNYIRRNLNLFFEGNSTQFSPYNGVEGTIWDSNNYIGAIMRFDIDTSLGGVIPGQQDGTVICSYQNDKTWRFTTIESPVDWNHPVSGTREFGLTTNTDGTYSFYTRGVDRVAETFDEFMGNLPNTENAFEGGDALWKQFQSNLENYINNPSNGGVAQKLSPTIFRPNWEDVRKVLAGEKPISDLGCK